MVILRRYIIGCGDCALLSQLPRQPSLSTSPSLEDVRDRKYSEEGQQSVVVCRYDVSSVKNAPDELSKVRQLVGRDNPALGHLNIGDEVVGIL